MTSFDLDNYIPEAVLEIDNEDPQTLHSQARWEMFMNELENVKNITILGSKMVESIITDTKDVQNKYYDKCFGKSFGRAGGAGFSKSYEKNCK